MELSADQEHVLFEIKLWMSSKLQPFWRLAGYAGTGKSFVISMIYNHPEILNLPVEKSVMVCAFTWKAAMNLRERGIANASSIHSLMYSIDESAANKGELKFIKKSASEIKALYSLIIVDEASMVAKTMRDDILSYGVPVLFVGDPMQLPPIQDEKNGEDFMGEAESKLEKIHRQAEGSPIIQLASIIREGKWGNLKYGKFGDGVFIVDPDEISDRSLLAADQILCAKNNTRQSLNRKLRKLKGYNSTLMPHIGEKLIVTSNHHEKGLYNGEVVIVKGITPLRGLHPLDDEGMTKAFLKDSLGYYTRFVKDGNSDMQYSIRTVYDGISELPEFGSEAMKFKYFKNNSIIQTDFAYAMTVHKSQGSQFNKVVVFEERMGDRKFHTRLLYTAVTRAKSKLFLAR